MVYRGLYSYRQRVRFSQTFFSYCFCMLSDFAKAFERKVWRVQVAHLHNAARARSSPSSCFQLSKNLGKDFFRYLWYCDKEQIECGLAWNWRNSTVLGLIDIAEIVACIFYRSENRATSQIWKILPNMVFPPIWGQKMAAFWACACKLSWTLLSPARVQPLYGAGRKESSGTGQHRGILFAHAPQKVF